MKRRALLLAWLASRAHAAVQRGQALAFPRDHGAHPEAQTEWWYATGWLGSEAAPRFGFQLTFFRSRTGLAEVETSRFAARQLLFAHAAITDLVGRQHLHAQRIARWSGDSGSVLAHAATADTDLRLAGWTLRRNANAYVAQLPADAFGIDLRLQPTQPLLLQGDAGFSRKGPDEGQASHYYSEPQLAVRGSVTLAGRRSELTGRGWLDREWSDAYLPPDAVGWDWIGINLFDGSALMAFRMRRADGSAVWAGGSFRAPGRAAVIFTPEQVRFGAGRVWTSPASQARYPVAWQIETPAGRFALRALMDGQELDSRGSTGAIYWEGLAELRDAADRRVGLGYLEMTGYAARLELGT
jgi:predicted secreted hydrolase